MLVGSSELLSDRSGRGQLCVEVSPSRSSVCLYPLSTAMAVPLVTRTRPQLPVRWEHLLGGRRSQPLPRVHSGDKHPTAQMGCPDRAVPTVPTPPTAAQLPGPLPAPQQGSRSGLSPHLCPPHIPSLLGCFHWEKEMQVSTYSPSSPQRSEEHSQM